MTKKDMSPMEWGEKSCPFWDTEKYGNYPCQSCHYVDFSQDSEGFRIDRCKIWMMERDGTIYG